MKKLMIATVMLFCCAGFIPAVQGQTISCDLVVIPDSGTLPFSAAMDWEVTNETSDYRRVAVHIDIVTQCGERYANITSGWMDLDGGETASGIIPVTFPATGDFVGVNDVEFICEDVTPAPYNLPPYAPSGDEAIATDQLTIYGDLQTVDCSITLLPESGILPFTTHIEVELTNRYWGQVRRMAARIDVELPGGVRYNNWRQGYTNLGPCETSTTSWFQFIPEYPSFIGETTFYLETEDVTPAPYNQPPYPAAGDTSTDSATVEGFPI